MDSVAQLLKDLLEESKKNRERFAELDEEMARRRAEASNTADAHASDADGNTADAYASDADGGDAQGRQRRGR